MAYVTLWCQTTVHNLQVLISGSLQKNGNLLIWQAVPNIPKVTVRPKERSRQRKTWLQNQMILFLAFLCYRSTPIHNGYSLSELLIGRKLHSTLPLATETLSPKWLDTEQLRKKELAHKRQQPENYNQRHWVSTLPELEHADKVWVAGKSSPVVIARKSSEPRFYVVKTEQSLLRRSRKHLVANPNETIGSESRKDCFFLSSLAPLNGKQLAWELWHHPNWQHVAFVLDGLCNDFKLGFSPFQILKPA